MPADEDRNTVLMVFLLVNNMATYNFVMKYGYDIDLTKKNKFNENTITLYTKYKEGKFNSNTIGKYKLY